MWPPLSQFARAVRGRVSVSVRRSCLEHSRALSSERVSQFINEVSALEKSENWREISQRLEEVENRREIIEQTCVLCAESVQSLQSQKAKAGLWPTHVTTLPSCTYHSLINASVTARNLDQLTELLGESKTDVRVASAIGISGLFNFYKPFLPHSETKENMDASNEGGKPLAFASEIESKIMGLFFHWVSLMDRDATLVQSQLLFNNMHFLYQDDWEKMMHFINNMTSSSSSHPSTVSVYDLLSAVDNTKASSFTLAAYDFLATNDIDKASEFLQNMKDRGHIQSSLLTLNQYSDIVRKAIPLAWSTTDIANEKTTKSLKRHTFNSRAYSQESVAIDISLAEFIDKPSMFPSSDTGDKLSTESVGDLECIKKNLDNLFSLASTSSSNDRKLRYSFYKNLLNCNRPRTLLSYENIRKRNEKLYYSQNSSGEPVHNPRLLDIEGYKCVLKAHANQLDVDGIFNTLSDWNQSSSLVSTAAVPESDDEFVTPDSSVYKVVISFFHMHPQFITSRNLERLFEQMQLDNVTPDDNNDIIALFRFCFKAQAFSLTNSLLAWVESMRDYNVDTENASKQQSTDVSSVKFDMNIDLIDRSSIPKKDFSQADLVKIYDYALETNALEIDNGDRCLDILFEMKKNGIELNGNRVAYVMKAFKNSKNFEAVLELFHSMGALKVKRDLYHVSLAVVAYLRTDRVSTGLALLNKFEAAGQELKDFCYFAAAFELLRRLGAKPSYVPFEIDTDNADVVSYMQREEATRKCVDLFVHAIKGGDMFPASKRHLQFAIRNLDADIMSDITNYVEELVSKIPGDVDDNGLEPAAIRFHKLLKSFQQQSRSKFV